MVAVNCAFTCSRVEALDLRPLCSYCHRQHQHYCSDRFDAVLAQLRHHKFCLFRAVHHGHAKFPPTFQALQLAHGIHGICVVYVPLSLRCLDSLSLSLCHRLCLSVTVTVFSYGHCHCLSIAVSLSLFVPLCLSVSHFLGLHS